MSDYVRVRDLTTGHEYTTRRELVVEGLEVLDKPALGRDRLPRPPKYRVPLGEKPSASAVIENPSKPVAIKAAEATTPETATSAGSNKEN